MPKPNLKKLNKVQEKNKIKPQLSSFKLSVFTQFYPPYYAATGQRIDELASQLGHLSIHVQVDSLDMRFKKPYLHLGSV